jgi:hypothetical protein
MYDINEVLSKKAMKGSANLMYGRHINLLYNYSNNKVELMNTHIIDI